MSFDLKKITAHLYKVELFNLMKIHGIYDKQIYYRRCGCPNRSWCKRTCRSRRLFPRVIYSKDLKREGFDIPEWITGKLYRIDVSYYDRLQIKNGDISFRDNHHITYTENMTMNDTLISFVYVRRHNIDDKRYGFDSVYIKFDDSHILTKIKLIKSLHRDKRSLISMLPKEVLSYILDLAFN